MHSGLQLDVDEYRDLELLSDDGERILCRGRPVAGDDGDPPVLIAFPAAGHQSLAVLHRLAHEYALKDELDSAWAARPLELRQERGRTQLLIEDPGGEPLERILGEPMETGRFLQLAIGIASALSKTHQRGLTHKDLPMPE